MSKAMVPLRSYPPFIHALVQMSNPLLAIIVSAIFTALIQSSTASVGVIIVLATQGLVTLKAGVCLVLGANIGTGLTAFLAAAGATREAGRVAIANMFFKVVGVVLILPFLNAFLVLVQSTSPELPRQIANAHTGFNVIITVIFLPLTKQVAKIVTRMLPDTAGRNSSV